MFGDLLFQVNDMMLSVADDQIRRESHDHFTVSQELEALKRKNQQLVAELQGELTHILLG